MSEHIVDQVLGREKREAVRFAEYKEKNNVMNKRNQKRLLSGLELQLDTSAEHFEASGQKFTNYGLEPELIIVENSEEALVLQRMLKAFVADQFKRKKQTIKYEFPNEKISDFLEVMQEWWDSVDTTQQKQMGMHEFSALMVEKGIVSKTFEVIRMVKTTIGEKIGQTGIIKYSQFQKIFARAFLRGALMNIYYYLRKITDREGVEQTTGAEGSAERQNPAG